MIYNTLFKKNLLIFLILFGVLFFAKISWAATYYVATNGDDSRACATSALPCLTFTRAYNVASGGDTIEVAAGTYGAQTIPLRSLGTSVVTFRPASGASVTLGTLNIYGSYIEVQNMTARNYNIKPTAWNYPVSDINYVTLRNMRGKNLFIVGNNVSVIGGDYGGFDACDSTYSEDGVQIWQQGGIASSYVTFDGVTIHDVTDHNNVCADVPPPAAGRHVDCMQILAGHYITVKNSQFYNCATSDIIARPYIDTLNDITLENNFFQEVANPGNVVLIGASEDTVGGTNVIRYNYLERLSNSANYSGSMSIYGNIFGPNFASWACQNGTYAYNVYMGGARCGTNYTVGIPSFIGPTPSPSYLNGIVPNYRLASTDMVAKDAGNPTLYPTTDIDGDTRYVGSAPDAGADEIGALGGGDTTPPAAPSGVVVN